MKTKRRQSRTRSEIRTSRRDFIRRTFCLLILLLCAVPMLGGGVQALWVLPAAICISMHEEMYFCMGAGVTAGLLIDLACGSVLGANAIFLVCYCTFVSLLFEQILRRSFWHYLVMTAGGVFLRSALSWILTVGIFRLPGRETVWQAVLLPSSLLTVAAAIPVYLLYLPPFRLLTKRVRSMDAVTLRRDWQSTAD